jgi:hypothetical protein
MNNFKQILKGKAGLILLFAAISIYSCADDKTSIYNPNYNNPTAIPVISAIAPSNGYLAGVEKITISGSNFVTDTSKIRLYFDGKRGTILSITPTTIEAVGNKAAIGDSVDVKIIVLGAEEFNPKFTYKLSSPFVSLSPDLKNTDVVTGNTQDAAGNTYLHIFRDGADIGIQKIDAVTEAMTQLIPASNLSIHNDLLIGNDGKLLSIQSKRGAVFVWNPGVSTRWTATYIAGTSSVIDEIALDDNNRLWTVGRNPSIARFDYTTPSSVKRFTSMTDTLTAVQYFNNKLYIAGKIQGALQVYAYEIDNTGELVNGQTIYNMSQFTAGVVTTINCLEVASDGTVYIGVDSPLKTRLVDGKVEYYTENGLIEIQADGSSADYLYPGVIPGNIVFMFWGEGESLNIVQAKITYTIDSSTSIVVQQQNISKLNMLDKRRAAYFGG